MKKKLNYYIVFIVAVIGLFFSGYLYYSHYYSVEKNSLLYQACSISGTFNCEAVNLSKYSEIFDIPIAAFGVLFFLIVLLISFLIFFERDKTSSKIFLSAGWVLSFFSIIAICPLLFISVFYIRVLCSFCIITWICNILIFLLFSLALKKSEKKSLFQSIIISLKRLIMLPKIIFKESKLILFGLNIVLICISILITQSFFSAQKDINKIKRSIQVERSLIHKFINNKPVKIDLEGIPPVMGNNDAKLTIVEYMNFDCPACKKSYLMMKKLINKYPDKIKLYVKNYPLDGVCNHLVSKKRGGLTCIPSLISMGLRKTQYYKPYVNYFLRSPRPLNNRAIVDALNYIKLDDRSADNYIKNTELRKKLLKEINEANKLGLTGTPTIVINGRALPSGIIPQRLFEVLIKLELSRVYGP